MYIFMMIEKKKKAQLATNTIHFSQTSIEQKFLICEGCVIMARKSFFRDEKSSYWNEERLQLAELVEQFKKEHLKEKEGKKIWQEM